jgi:antitoxin (DNA-binding transcriptional repressor) of toxin-antitoxin stability system
MEEIQEKRSMATVTIEEAQSRLPDLIEGLTPGEELVITKGQQPIAKLAKEPATATPKKRRAGSAAGQVWMSPDFDEPLEDFKEYME